jgi:hypothetical protein
VHLLCGLLDGEIHPFVHQAGQPLCPCGELAGQPPGKSSVSGARIASILISARGCSRSTPARVTDRLATCESSSQAIPLSPSAMLFAILSMSRRRSGSQR